MPFGYLRFYERDVPVGAEYVIVREQILTGQTDMDKALDRLKVLIDSSTPIVVIETVEEVRAVRMVRAACSALNLAAFEWTIASGLARSGTNSATAALGAGALVPGGHRGGEVNEVGESAKALYDSREPAKMLANLEGISIEAAFVLKDLQRHMDDPVVVRLLRDVGQKFATNRRTVILTAPKISVPPDRPRLRQIIDEVLLRVSKTHTLERRLEPAGVDAMAENLRGLTEEEAERAI